MHDTGDHTGPRTRVAKVERGIAIAEYDSAVLTGTNPREARRQIQERYGVSRLTANTWIRVAKRRRLRRAQANRDELLADAVARLDEVFKLAIGKGNLDAAIRASTEQSKLLDLYPENARESFLEERAAFVRNFFELWRRHEKDFVVIQRMAVDVRELMSRSKARAVVVDGEPAKLEGGAC